MITINSVSPMIVWKGFLWTGRPSPQHALHLRHTWTFGFNFKLELWDLTLNFRQKNLIFTGLSDSQSAAAVSWNVFLFTIFPDFARSPRLSIACFLVHILGGITIFIACSDSSWTIGRSHPRSSPKSCQHRAGEWRWSSPLADKRAIVNSCRLGTTQHHLREHKG